MAEGDTTTSAGAAAAGLPVVLVIDDTPEYLTLLGELLAPEYAVRVARNGRRGLELANVEPRPDVILLDVVMPEMDGYAVLAALRADARTRDIPVIFVTSLDATPDEERGLDMGAADYIVKPMRAPIVLSRVRKELELKQARDRQREQNAYLAAEVERRTRIEAEVRKLNATLRARTAALERSVADLEAFSYTVSHDLRAPLRAIVGFTRIIEETEVERLTDEGRRLLDRVIAGAARMSSMIEDILEYSRTERTTMSITPVELGALAREVVDELADSHPQTMVEIGPLPAVRADPTMLRQVLENLVGNALKFSSRAAAPKVEIFAEERGGETVFVVRDNGVGFDGNYAGRLFGLFQRLHSEREFPGAGVGLATVKRLIERHGGWIRAESIPDVRTTFSFTLAAQEPSEH